MLAAIDAEANIGLPEAGHTLVLLLNSNDDDIVDAANEALARISHEHCVNFLKVFSL